jgi:hypothetical protein
MSVPQSKASKRIDEDHIDEDHPEFPQEALAVVLKKSVAGPRKTRLKTTLETYPDPLAESETCATARHGVFAGD